ncbi:MAG TPA: 5-oxoprolinase subunit PxpB [Rhodanobacteraceae bacterium]|nr:5-oxoprolinase subunit PxpB [Rhodanobacteraceae bacterium]
MNPFALEPLGDSAVLVRLGDCIDTAINRSALALAETLRAAALPGIRDIVPAYASVCVHYDIAAFARAAGPGSPHLLAAERVGEIAARFFEANTPGTDAQDETPVLEIPVRYGGEFGPDLGDVATHAGIDEQAVIERHASANYRVAMLGFMPGFPYLLGLDESLHTPRRANPRTRVPAGSVAIGGAQTGIYPRELPGGWQLIGRTPLVLFDPGRAQPALLRPGQRVRFRAIEAGGEFAALMR